MAWNNHSHFILSGISVDQKHKKGPLDGPGSWSHIIAIILNIYLVLFIVMTIMLNESLKFTFESFFMALVDEVRELQALCMISDIAGKDLLSFFLII